MKPVTSKLKSKPTAEAVESAQADPGLATSNPLENPHPLCKGIQKNGQPCRAPAMHAAENEGYCFFHSPLQEQRRKEVHVNGGRLHGRPGCETKRLRAFELPAEIKTLDDIFHVIELTTRALLLGRLESRQASAAGFNLNLMRGMIGERDIEARLAKLEQAIDERKKEDRGEAPSP